MQLIKSKFDTKYWYKVCASQSEFFLVWYICSSIELTLLANIFVLKISNLEHFLYFYTTKSMKEEICAIQSTFPPFSRNFPQ